MDELRAKLKGARRQLTITVNSVEEAIKAKNVVSVESRMRMLDECVTSLRELDREMSWLCEAETGDDAEELAEKEGLKAFEYWDKASSCQSKAIAWLKETRMSNAKPAAVGADSRVRLEKLSLPTFNGDPLSFHSFWECFESRVHSNGQLNPVDKFDYLGTCCKGVAADSLKAIPRTSAGYELAIDTLKRRFGRTAPVINMRLTELVEMKPLPDDCSTGDLRKMLDVMSVHVRSLLSLGLSETGGAEWIGPILVARLPLRVRMRWEELTLCSTSALTKGLCKDLKEFLEFFTHMVEVEEASRSVSTRQSKNEKPSVDKRDPTRSRSRAVLSSSFSTHVRTEKCPVCESTDHTYAGKCNDFLKSSLEDRRKMCQRHSLCFNCLSSNHLCSLCPSVSRCRECNRKHHTLLHGFSPVGKPEVGPIPKSPGNICNAAQNTVPAEQQHGVVLQSCKARAYGPNGNSAPVRVLFDSCSTLSFIKRSSAQSLGLATVRNVSLTINTFGCGRVEQNFPVCGVDLGPLRGGSRTSIELIATENLVHPIQGCEIDISRYDHLKSLFFSEDYESGNPKVVDVIIGADLYHDFVLYKRLGSGKRTPVAIKTTLGWTLHGPYASTRRIAAERNPNTDTMFFCERASESSSALDLENLWSMEAINVFPERDKDWVEPELREGRVSTHLPWKVQEVPLSNREQVDRLQQRFDSRLTAKQRTERGNYFSELQELGIVEPCTSTLEHAWYLPHHCIWKRKLRVVFDGSFGKPSLNDMLFTGPNLLNVIPTCLTSFRLYQYPIAADIEKAFLQVGIEPFDRDFVRYILDGIDFRFCRVPFGLNCSPAILNSTLCLLYDSFESECPDTVKTLRQCTYVDDVLASFPDERSLLKFKEESIALFKHGSMNLRGWTSSPEKVLGVSYEASSDEMFLVLNRHSVFDSAAGSRRSVLSYAASLFDPLGFCLPWTLRLRQILQATWVANLGWDDPLPADLMKVWHDLLQEAKQQERFFYPRCLNFKATSTFELHAFSDASMKAYATCVYLVSPDSSVFVYARSRVTPLKQKLTTPRAELMAALLSARAVKLLKENLAELREITTFFWSDSSCVLGWLRGEPLRLKLFVRNRVKEILSVDGTWLYVPTSTNPADLASRGISASALHCSQLWQHGPSWLMDRSSWPNQLNPLQYLPEILVSAAVSPDDSSTGEDIICSLLERCSSLTRFERVLAWIFRFYDAVRGRSECPTGYSLDFSERQNALFCSIRHVQEENFPSEVSDVRSGSPVSSSSPLNPLRPSWDDQKAVLVTTPRTTEPPKIFLPARSRLTFLIIVRIHLRLFHAGTDRTLALFQSVYWTSRSRTVIKRVLRSCNICKRSRASRYAQNEGQLTDFRSNYSHPFQHVGVDHAGPLHIQGSKVYVLLFTCACIRAVHLELVNSLSTAETALGFRRFQARRGNPVQVYSDNAACFRSLAPLVQAKWQFIPERSPQWGGWWERMVQTVKRALKKVVGRTSLNSSELHTVLVEIEGAVNERPLTYVSDDIDSPSPLTPASFLHLKQPLGAPWLEVSAQTLGQRWKHRCKIAADLVTRWRLEYLATLRQWRYQRTSGAQPQVGDIALLDEGPRGSWPLVRIVRLHPGKDNYVRMVTVLLRGRLTRRLTRMLCPLECLNDVAK